jgi:DNA-binding NarL/FixJ family response regulator
MPIRLHLADDHTMFRQGLEAILASEEGIEVVGTSSTGGEATDQVRMTKPDVIVTQLDMQPKSAEEIIEGLREASPDSRIVVLTLWDNLRYVQAVAKMAIDAMMHKSSLAEGLLATIGAVSRNPDGGNAVISMPRGLLQRLGDDPAGGLSERELEVLVLAARGLSNRFIAKELHISEATVKRHLANVYEKIGVRSRNEAVRTALVEQWIGLHEITSADGDGSRDGGWDGTERRSGLDRRKGSGRWTGSERRGGSDRRNGSPGGPDSQGG